MDLTPDANELERLGRRLQREREARRQAEAIAERGLRDLYAGQQRLKLLETIATVSNQSASVNRTLALALEEICGFTGWTLGHVFLTRGRGAAATLRSSGVWHGLDERRLRFQEASERQRFTPGVGLPGRVYASRRPVWVVDVTGDDNFPRVQEARQAGLRAGFAFPVLVGRQVAAVLEFFTEQPHEPDEALLQTLAQIGTQLGRVIERSRAERRLKQQNLRLTALVAEAERQRLAAEAASRAKSSFLAVTSHEIRTPLHAVLGLTEALRREDLTAKQQALAEGVLDAGAMLLRLLDAVLDLSKIEAGRVDVSAEPLDLRQTVQTVAQIWRAKAEEEGLSLDLDLDALPSPCGIVSDKGKIEQTLVNLLSNAIKFAPRGGGVQIRAVVTPVGELCTARLEVEDAGPGVLPEDRERIFRPYEQSTLGRETGGAGLGLSICAGNVAALGGRIGLDNPPEGGSRFWFEFPAPRHAAPATRQPVRPETPALERPLRVLAAEDHPANRQVLQVLLSAAEVEITFAETGLQALESVQRAPFDLVLMDVNMPVMDGVAAVRAIRALGGEWARIPIHMLTANVFDEDIARYRTAGADGVLKKPLELQTLFTLLATCAAEAVELGAVRALDHPEHPDPHGVRAARQGL